jgi:hypothetical protein
LEDRAAVGYTQRGRPSHADRVARSRILTAPTAASWYRWVLTLTLVLLTPSTGPATALARDAAPTPVRVAASASPTRAPPAAPTSTPRPTPQPTLVGPTSTPVPTPTLTRAPTREGAAVIGSQVIGYSAEGRPIAAYQLGGGAHSVLIVGGIDGASESNTTALVDQLLARLQDEPDLLRAGFVLLFVPAVNPDGLSDGTRMLADGVDANRNWPTADWVPDTYVAGPNQIRGGGGPFPFSEPETRALAEFVERVQPSLIVSYHSRAALVMAGPAARALDLDLVYASVTGYAWGDWTAYPVTGDFAQWAEDQGIPTLEIELPDHTSTDFEANFAALGALLAELQPLVFR